MPNRTVEHHEGDGTLARSIFASFATIVTFLMVFVIQSTQNRDTKALQLKLDELIRVNKAARNSLMSLEEKSEPAVEKIKSAFVELASTGDWIGDGAASSRRSGRR
jgi:low affinity Fe/Cu permease